MVRALRDGSKTHTRRLFKQATGLSLSVGIWNDDPGVAELSWLHGDGPGHEVHETIKRVPCPYGKPGDRLWVREAWTTHACFDAIPPRDLTTRSIHYVADGQIETGKHRQAFHMPRWASRLTLEVANVGVERLNEISEADAIAEGIKPNWLGDLKTGPNGFGGEGWVPECGWRDYLNGPDDEPAFSAIESYRSLWESINGQGSWDVNPWVWVVEFKVLKVTNVQE